jgi:hypothetical protein
MQRCFLFISKRAMENPLLEKFVLGGSSTLEKTRIIPPPSGGGYRRDGRSPYSSEQ